MRQHPIRGIDDEEEPDEVKGVENHAATIARSAREQLPVLDESCQCLGDDLVAARR